VKMLYKLEYGYLISPPSTMVIEDRLVVNFPIVSKEHGYKELISEQKPLYNEAYQALQPIYEETETNILEKWEVINTLTLNEYKKNKLAELEDAYKEALQRDFESLGYTFSYVEEAQKNFTKVTALFALKPDKTDTPWNTNSHGIILLTKEQYLQVVEDAENQEWYNLGKLWSYKHKIEIAQSYEEVDKIIWEP
jgi:hypothetical protein